MSVLGCLRLAHNGLIGIHYEADADLLTDDELRALGRAYQMVWPLVHAVERRMRARQSVLDEQKRAALEPIERRDRAEHFAATFGSWPTEEQLDRAART